AGSSRAQWARCSCCSRRPATAWAAACTACAGTPRACSIASSEPLHKPGKGNPTVSDYAKNVLVDAEWAVAHLDDPNVRFVEVDVDTSAYDQGHIPGAVAWNWTSQLSDGLRRDIVGRDDLAKLLGDAGIGDGTTIVLYGDNNNWFAAWAYW